MTKTSLQLPPPEGLSIFPKHRRRIQNNWTVQRTVGTTRADASQSGAREARVVLHTGAVHNTDVHRCALRHITNVSITLMMCQMTPMYNKCWIL